MAGYSTLGLSSSAWPEPMESVYQALPASGLAPANAQRRDISKADRLFMAAVVAIPRELRYGAVSWLGQAFRVSRQTVYDNAARIDVGAGDGQSRIAVPATDLPPAPHNDDQATLRRIPRLILSMLFPGGVSYRPMRVCLREAFGQTRAIGFISEMISRDGDRAGQILAGLQSPAKQHDLWISRDETYFSAKPMLLTVDPHRLVITSGRVEETADGQGWAIQLALLLEDYGPCRVHMSEDGATFYPNSLTETQLLLTDVGLPCEFIVQKDVRHIFTAAKKVQRAFDRPALKALEQVTRRERSGRCQGLTVISNMTAWRAAKKRADRLVARADEVRFWIGSLHDSFEIVDDCGCIRDFQINHWLLHETLEGLRALGHPQATKLAKTVTDQAPHLLSYMRWLDEQLPAWRRDNHAHFQDAERATALERAAARAWRLQRAVTNGHHRRIAAERAAAELDGLIGRAAVARQLAERLIALLDAAVRTSCASETINSILKPMLWAHRHFANRQSAQRWLNLFILWHNMRRFERGKRADSSPFELAGIKVYTPDGRQTTDWLEALGYPAAA